MSQSSENLRYENPIIQICKEYWRIALVIISLLAVLWVQFPRLSDSFRIDEDFRSFYWMNKFQDPELFPNDDLRGYRYVNVPFPWGEVPIYFYSLGYGLLFYIASFLVSPILFSKIIPFILMPIAALYLFEYGKSIQSSRLGNILAFSFIFLNLVSATSLSAISGLQRAFALPLTIALLYYLHQKKYLASTIVVLVSALIYPPAFLLITGAWGLFALKQKSPRFLPRSFLLLMIAFIISSLLLSPILIPRFIDAFKPDSTELSTSDVVKGQYKRLWNNPQHQAGGKRPLFHFFPFVGRGGLVNNGLDAMHGLILFSIGCLIFLIRKNKSLQLPNEIWCMLWSSLILFAMAWISILLTNSFLLYLPSRYTRVGLFLFLFLFVCINAQDAVEEALHSIQRNPRQLFWIIGGVETIVIGLVILCPSDRLVFAINMKWLLVPAGFTLGGLGIISIQRLSSSSLSISRPKQVTIARALIGMGFIALLCFWAVYSRAVSRGISLCPSRDERRLLKFIETMPKDVLLAGSPRALNNVPLFAKRQILFSREQVSKDPRLVLDMLNAYYAESPKPILEFCQNYSVDYLVVDLSTFSEDHLAEKGILFEPYNQELLPLVSAQDAFALEEVPDKAKLFQSGELFVITCNKDALSKPGLDLVPASE